MARPLRIEFPGAIYHVTSRGDRREEIFGDDQDRLVLLDVVGQAMSRFDAQVLAYCLMGNHYHFVVFTRQANLSRLMRHINGVYTQRFNRRHDKEGHLFQGRFKSILVDRDAYLLEVCRYVELNPVRAGLVKRPGDWVWSSYLPHIGEAETPPWLDTDGLQGHLLGRPVRTLSERRAAVARYEKFVASAANVRLWDSALRQQIYLGDDDFVARMQAQAAPERIVGVDVPSTQRRSAKSFRRWMAEASCRDEGVFNAYTEGGMTLSSIARELEVSVPTVSRCVKKWESVKSKR